MKNSYWTYSIENVTKQLRFLYLVFCYYPICEETLNIYDRKCNRTVENPLLENFVLWFMKNSHWTYSIENVTKQLRFLYLLYCYYLICEETTLSIFDQKFNRTVENPILAILFILWRNHIELRYSIELSKKGKESLHHTYWYHTSATLRTNMAIFKLPFVSYRVFIKYCAFFRIF